MTFLHSLCAVAACTMTLGMSVSFFSPCVMDKVLWKGDLMSINKPWWKNFEELGLTSLRLVYDEIMYHGGNIKDFPIPSSLLLACQSAHMMYKNDLDRQKAESEKTEITNKRKLLIEELNIVKKKKTDEQSLIKQLESDSDNFVLQAGETSDVADMRSLVMKASSLKKTAEEKAENCRRD